MSKLCIGFEVHQPYRLNSRFDHKNGVKIKDLEKEYFSSKNKEILEKVAGKCYIPATEIVLEGLDNGFKCAFSISGTLIEQLEKWNTDALDLFKQAARHKNTELIAQTYYHSIASLFDDLEEFELQVKLHKKLLKDVFGVVPRVMENTEFLFNNSIARSAKKMGFEAIYSEGVERILDWRSPNYVYTCQGIKVLMRNYKLSDDIAFRFNNREWEQYPLTADKFADWIASVPGDYINIFVDYETFGEHHWDETGILDFLRWLPKECLGRGIEFETPSAISKLEPREELDVDETISWADIEKDASAWAGNTIQKNALKAVQRAKIYAKNKKLWRYLQTSDHFYYMASKFGSCGDVHNYFSPEACSTFSAFEQYMNILSHYEQKFSHRTGSKKTAMILRSVSPDKAFNFWNSQNYTGFSAYSLDDLAEMLNHVPEDSVEYHIQRNDFSRWIGEALGDKKLASVVENCKNRIDLTEAIDRERDLLWKRLK
ncbi:alpha-amlyase [Methanocella sp. CWC-04]|uniref:Alpha-amlyase n=1 Tax=Methanooceanicella nereidis TaxID=2052831 RepID=A0AAP2R9V4_9EURY|nr:alpha-amlyase [Methanocella sp. CWC-04]